MIEFRIVPFHDVPWQTLDELSDRNVFQTREWVAFLAETQKAHPIVAEILDGPTLLGYFTGLTFRRFGIKMLGSPAPGWTTPYMGFNLIDDQYPRERLIGALRSFAFEKLRCVHIELCDRHIPASTAAGLPYPTSDYHTLMADLTGSNEDLRRRLSSSCRWSIRRAQRSGIVVESASNPDFVSQFYAQLTEVFAKRGRVPTYPIERVHALVNHVHSTGHLLLLRAIDNQGRCIATGLFPGMNGLCEFWGNASYRFGLRDQPNELLHWHAMCFWKSQGVKEYDLGGAWTYKRKYSKRSERIARFHISKIPFAFQLRERMRRFYKWKGRVSYRVFGAR